MPAFFNVITDIYNGFLMSSNITHMEKLIAPSLADMGYDIIHMKISSGEEPILSITIECSDETATNVEDCASASRAISAILDVEDPIKAAYVLEVSSPGIDRQLTRPRDFERFAGNNIKVDMEESIDGQRRFKGKLLGFIDQHIHLEINFNGDDVEIALPLNGIKQAKLVMSDSLIKATS